MLNTRFRGNSFSDKIYRYVKKWESLLSNLEKVQNNEGYFKTYNIAKILNISIFSARNILRTLLRSKIIKGENGKYTILKFPI